MKFVINRYNIDFHVILEDPPPIPGARLEHHAWGLPPVEVRPIWTVEFADLMQLLDAIERLGVCLDVSKSAYWSEADVANPGERLFGLSVTDDWSCEVDPRDRPIQILRGA